MKSHITLMIVSVLLFTLVACGDNGSGSGSEESVITVVPVGEEGDGGSGATESLSHCSYDVESIFEKHKDANRNFVNRTAGSGKLGQLILESAAAEQTIIDISDDQNCENEKRNLRNVVRKAKIGLQQIYLNWCFSGAALDDSREPEDCYDEYYKEIDKINEQWGN